MPRSPKNIAKLQKEWKHRYHHDKEFRERVKVTSRKNYSADRHRDNHYRRLYGFSLVGFNKLLKRQNNLCAICRKPVKPTRFRHLQVDHCHKTGKVRGLLCFHCNRCLGWLELRIPVIMAYIGKSKTYGK